MIEALRRVLSWEATRIPLSDDLDFHRRQTSEPVEVEVTLGELGPALEQDFFDELELWDADGGAVVEELPSPFEADKGARPWVVRLCYRAVWDGNSEQADHWVDFPKFSHPTEKEFARVGRRLRDLPFSLAQADVKPMSLGPRGAFRRIVGGSEGQDFAAATTALSKAVEEVGGEFTASRQVVSALDAVLESIRPVLGLSDRPAQEIVRFVPEGGSVGGILRSLAPSITLGEGASMPLSRQGSTAEAAIRVAEAAAALPATGGIFAIDDLGEDLDASSAQHLAATVRRTAAQAWVTTRRPSVAQAFRPQELVRLIETPAGDRKVHVLHEAKTRQQRTELRYALSKLLPAMSAGAVVIVEGQHDHESLTSLAARLLDQDGEPLPAARGVALVDSGMGKAQLAHVSAAARMLGFHTVAVLDFDHKDDDRARDALLADCDCVVRLVYGHAVERVLIAELNETVLRDTLNEVISDLAINRAQLPNTLDGRRLQDEACAFLKSAGGLHAQFIDHLPGGVHPPLACALLRSAVQAASSRTHGAVQL